MSLNSRMIAPWIAGLASILLIGVLWSQDQTLPDNLLHEVRQLTHLPWLETTALYAYLHLFTICFPGLYSFDRRMNFAHHWRHLFPALCIVAAIFIAWDVYFTQIGVWGFNPDYFLGIRFLHLPIEEWLFFFTIPYACLFIYESLRYFIPNDPIQRFERPITLLLIPLFFGVGFSYWSHIYTATTFLLAGSFLLYHLLFIDGSYRGRFYFMYAISWIPFLIVNGALTGGFTEEAVVLYNPEEYLGIRIISVPLDDSVYSFLLLLANVTLFEYFRSK